VRALAAVLLAVGVLPAHAREVTTGQPVSLGRDAGPRVQAVYWVEPRTRDEVELVALPAPLAIGDELDVLDERGFVARVRVFALEKAACGSLRYARARARVSWPGLPRRLTSGALAVGPARGRASRGRVLPADDVRPGRTPIDVDGDGEADIARQVTLECGAERGRRLACLETWARELDGWRRVARAEIGPCG
jgi:hypothetical protein